MPLTPGDDFDRYRLEALIGEGGMGRVFRAFDPKLRRRVAIKILQANRFSEGTDDVARVMREARAAAALDHPGVVAVFDVSEAEGHPFIVMEYVDGRSLRALVGADEISINERLRWMTDVARCLAAAHRTGLVHRDIKPENVMIRHDGAAKLLDFGIARRLETEADPNGPVLGKYSAIPAESSAIGTPWYMAPEQVQRRPLDARADQFSWGVLAYELFTGSLPWKTANDGNSSSIAVVTEQPELLRTGELGLPNHVGAVIHRALEKSPGQRFESMDALVAALSLEALAPLPLVFPDVPKESFKTVADTQQGTHTEVDPPPIPEASPKGRQKITHVFPFVALVLAVSAIGGGVLVFQSKTQPNPPLLKAHLATIAFRPLVHPAEVFRPNTLAAAAFAKGIHHFQQAALALSIDHYQTAIEYEPRFAAAHLRLAIARLIDGPHPAGSESFLEARRLRRALEVRDSLLLDAFAPAFDEEPPGLDETARKLIDLQQHFPNDPEILLLGPMILTVAGRDDDGAKAFRAYTEKYPKMATPWLALAYIHGRRDELELAHEALEKCRSIESDAIDCIWFDAKIDAYAGRCKDMEAVVTHWRHLKPDNVNAVSMLAQAQMAQNANAAVIDATLALGAHDLPLGEATRIKQRFIVSRHILEGKFLEADRILTALPHEIHLENIDYLWNNELRVALHEEMGDQAGAVAIASDVLLRKKNLPGMGDVHVEGIADDPTMAFHEILFAAGTIDRPEFEKRRETWMTTWRSRGASRSDRDLWTRAYAGPASTPEAAMEALKVLEPLGAPLRFFIDHLLIVDTARVYLLAGRPKEAATLLGQASSSCLGPLEPLRFVQAHALLGRAQEALDNHDAACNAYRVVLRHWGSSRPGSVTVKHTRNRWKALGCKGD
ncbi:MAG TPA: protein kinase [Polyangium sp.]|nr:protein kinase [Polyangium sp.]